MGLSKRYRLGNYIARSTKNNRDLTYGTDLIVGVTSEGKFSEPKGNVDGVNLKPYKIVNNGDFVYNPSRLNLGSIAYRTEGLCIVSHLYVIFHLNELGKNKILPEYLFMYLRRQEFYREVEFRNFGSQRPEFSYNDMKEIYLPIPPIEAQQKAVDIYNGLKENLAAYESGLEDLKLTCDGFIDDLKHHTPKEKLFNLLYEVDNRNEEVSITDVKGINIEKQFMPTIAKIDESSLGKYKIVNPGQFAFSGMQTGRDCCIRIALLSGQESVIVSPAYTTLEIKENVVIPEYIMLWFSREESDRYGWFASDGSVRSNLDLDRFYGIEIPLPDIKIQRAIADIYSCYIERKRIAEELKEQLKNICPLLLRGAIMAGN